MPAPESGGREVVGAVVIVDGRALIVRRAGDDFLGGMWELPSGKVEPGETHEDALRREVDEEVGLEVGEVGARVGSFSYESMSGKKTVQHTYLVTTHPGAVRLTEHDAHRWIGLDELAEAGLSRETAQHVGQALALGPRRGAA